MNYNFAQLRTWMRNKVGVDLNSANIVSPGSISAVGTVSGASWSGPFTASGNVSLGSTGTTTTLNVLGTVAAMGAPVSVTAGPVQTAATDGFVFVTLTTSSTCNQGPAYASGYAGPGLPLRGQTSVHGGCANQDYATSQGSFMMPVRKGEQYQIGLAGNGGSYSLAASFMPLGR